MLRLWLQLLLIRRVMLIIWSLISSRHNSMDCNICFRKNVLDFSRIVNGEDGLVYYSCRVRMNVCLLVVLICIIAYHCMNVRPQFQRLAHIKLTWLVTVGKLISEYQNHGPSSAATILFDLSNYGAMRTSYPPSYLYISTTFFFLCRQCAISFEDMM